MEKLINEFIDMLVDKSKYYHRTRYLFWLPNVRRRKKEIEERMVNKLLEISDVTFEEGN